MAPGFKYFLLLLFLVVSILPLSRSSAWSAEPAAENAPQPIKFWADRSIYNSKSKRAVLEGRVKVTQAGSTIVADHMTIIFQETGSGQTDMDPDSIEKIEAQGHVRIEFDRRIATGEKAEYYALERKLIISGPDTKFVDGQDEISAATITYYRDDGKVEFTSGEGRQVKGIVHTSEKGLN